MDQNFSHFELHRCLMVAFFYLNNLKTICYDTLYIRRNPKRHREWYYSVWFWNLESLSSFKIILSKRKVVAYFIINHDSLKVENATWNTEVIEVIYLFGNWADGRYWQFNQATISLKKFKEYSHVKYFSRSPFRGSTWACCDNIFWEVLIFYLHLVKVENINFSRYDDVPVVVKSSISTFWAIENSNIEYARTCGDH